MKNLKNKILLLFFLFHIGCTTISNGGDSIFVVKRELNGVVETVVTPDRVLLQCVDSEEDPDEGGRYLFMILMLDEKSTVTTSMWGLRPDKRSCERVQRDIYRVLKNAKSVYIGSWGRLSDRPREEDRKLSYAFPIHGTFYDNGRVLQFGVITNDRGECYNPMANEGEPCLEYPFPIEKYEKQLK